MSTQAVENSAWLERRNAAIPRGVVNAHPLVLERGQGTEVWDVDGRRYLDFVGGIGVLNIGHNHPAVVTAIQEQLKKITHPAFQVAAYPTYVELAERLNQLVGGDEEYKTVFSSTGAEAVENAIKIARSATNRSGVLAFTGAFHGRTLLGTTLTGMSAPYRQNFGPFANDIYRAPYPNELRGMTTEKALAAIQELFDVEILPERLAAIILEPVQGDGGFLTAPKPFMKALRQLCDEHGIVLIVDEIQAGFGRTGSWFAFQQLDVQPDLVTVAKSLAGGLPLSGVVGRASLMESPLPGGLGGTYGGNAVACAAALAVIDTYEKEGLLERSMQLGAYFRKGLESLAAQFDVIGDVRGLGFMLAIEIVKDRQSMIEDADRAARIIDAAREAGLLVIKCGVKRNTIRFLPPIVTTEAQLDEALGMLAQALDKTA